MTLDVTAAGTVSNFNYITISQLAHTFMGDLTATLTHDGITVDLFDHIGGTSLDYNSDPGDGYMLSSSSTYSFAYAGANYSAFNYQQYNGWGTVSTGTYAAQSNATGGADAADAANTLQLFNGQQLSGNWTLNIYDNAPQNSGSLSGFILNITSGATPEPSALPYTAFGAAMLAFGAAIRSLRRSRHVTCAEAL